MAAYPPGLPALKSVRAVSRSEPDTTIRTQVEAGIPHVRRRFTSGVEAVGFQAIFNKRLGHLDTLRTFYRDTLKNGSLRFDMEDPVYTGLVEWRFTSPPSISLRSGFLYEVSISLERLP